jgi:hypothetical protein
MTASSPGANTRAWRFIILYVFAYLAASSADLASTSLGLRRPGASEKNVFATKGGEYAAARAWALTAAGAVFMVGCIWFAKRNASRVDERWLAHPVRSFGKLYLSPFSEAGRRVSPLHLLAVAVAFVPMRLLAAANNLLVYLYGFGPIGELIKAIGSRTSALIGFAVGASAVFIALMLALSPFAARILRAWRR